MSAYLLDTHTLIWFLHGDNSLSVQARIEIENEKNVRFVSIATLFEIAIKLSLGKLSLKIDYSELKFILRKNDITILNVDIEDTSKLISLPLHHRDPFDRMIIAQGISNNLTIITKDPEFRNYPCAILW